MVTDDFPVNRVSLAIIAGVLVLPLCATAEEGGSGHYLPGSMASFVDGVPAEPTFITRLNYIHYDGDIGASRAIPIAGLTALDVNAKSDGLGLTLLWAPDWSLGDKWQYAMSATVPMLSMQVTANVQNGLITVQQEDKKTGLGDIILMPLMFNYHISPDLNTNYRLAVYAPTGNYKQGDLANTGKNFWTVEPTAAVIYLGQKNGIEASFFLGADFNSENHDTDYQSGVQVHMDGTLAQHFPLWGGAAGAGITGGWYQQVTDDSGDGARLGAFKAREHYLGPVVSYMSKVGGRDVIAELKWMHEFDNKNRPEGNTVFFKVLAKF
jgi:hypothetical protein